MTLRFTRETEEIRRQLFTVSYKVSYQLMDSGFNASYVSGNSINKLLLDSKEFSLENTSRSFGKSRIQLRDSNTAKVAGEIVINGWGENPFWEDAPSDPNAKIIIGGQEYNFRNISSWQGLSVFSKNRVRQFNFRLYNIYGNEFITYQINLSIPAFQLPDFYATCSFEGVAEINTENHLLIAIGFFLMQLSFANEGKDNNG